MQKIALLRSDLKKNYNLFLLALAKNFYNKTPHSPLVQIHNPIDESMKKVRMTLVVIVFALFRLYNICIVVRISMYTHKRKLLLLRERGQEKLNMQQASNYYLKTKRYLFLRFF